MFRQEVGPYSLRRRSVLKLREVANIELFTRESHNIKIDLWENHKVEPYSLRRIREVDSMAQTKMQMTTSVTAEEGR